MDATASDLIELLDRLARDGATEAVLANGVAIIDAARNAGLIGNGGEEKAARWIGELINDERLRYGATSGGSRPVPPRATWSYSDVQIHHDYSLTDSGRRDAAETRRLRDRDRALEVFFADRALTPLAGSRAAIAEPARALQRALEEQRAPEAIGAAKELVESACRAVLADQGTPAAPTVGLAALVRLALVDDAASDEIDDLRISLARRLAGVADALSVLRNTAGSGHGRAAPSAATAVDADLAAGVATILTRQVLLVAEARRRPPATD